MGSYVVVVIGEDDSSHTYGPWRKYDKARAVYDAALNATDDIYDQLDVRLERVERWPGLRAWRASFE